MDPSANTAPTQNGPAAVDHRMRALALEAELEGRLATRVETYPAGLALFRDDLPRVAELNLLRLEPGTEPEPGTLIDFVDQLQAGLPQRSLRVVDDATAERLRPHFAAAGWVVDRVALMVSRKLANPDVDTGPIEEVELDRLDDARMATLRRAHRDLESAEQMAEIGTTLADGVETRAWGAVLGLDVTAYAVARVVGDAAKLTEVDANDRSHGRGLGRAVVWAAVRDLRRCGAKVIAVEAADETWAKWTYHRLGFEEVGSMHRFVRPWG
jgi:GNAT superfamily N-acetyltransferase